MGCRHSVVGVSRDATARASGHTPYAVELRPFSPCLDFYCNTTEPESILTKAPISQNSGHAGILGLWALGSMQL